MQSCTASENVASGVAPPPKAHPGLRGWAAGAGAGEAAAGAPVVVTAIATPIPSCPTSHSVLTTVYSTWATTRFSRTVR